MIHSSETRRRSLEQRTTALRYAPGDHLIAAILLSAMEQSDGSFCLWMTQGSWARTLHLAFQSIGIIYGDIGTSPLYVYSSTFPDGIRNNDDLLGVLSLIIYSLILLPMLKYVFIVLYADDNGDGKLIVPLKFWHG